jgi:hypothetical protein
MDVLAAVDRLGVASLRNHQLRECGWMPAGALLSCTSEEYNKPLLIR